MNQEHANAGYVVDAAALVAYFCSEQSRIDGHKYSPQNPIAQDLGWENYLKRLLNEAAEDEEAAEKLCEVLGLAMRLHGLPEPNDCFVMNDEDTSDDLERGGVYLAFDEDALYVVFSLLDF